MGGDAGNGGAAGSSGEGGASGGALDATTDRDGSSGKDSGTAQDAAGDGGGRGGASGNDSASDTSDASTTGTGGAAGTGGAGGTAGASTDGASGIGGGGSAGASGTAGAGGIDASSDGSGPTDASGNDVSDGQARCASLPLSAKTTWIVTASHSSLGNSQETDPLYNPPSHANDGNLSERWSTGKPQAGDEWLQVDFGRPVAIGQVTLQLGASSTDYPRGFATRVSDIPSDLGAPVLVSGAGQPNMDTVIVFGPAAIGRYLLISQTGSATSWWSVAEVNVSCTD